MIQVIIKIIEETHRNDNKFSRHCNFGLDVFLRCVYSLYYKGSKKSVISRNVRRQTLFACASRRHRKRPSHLGPSFTIQSNPFPRSQLHVIIVYALGLLSLFDLLVHTLDKLRIIDLTSSAGIGNHLINVGTVHPVTEGFHDLTQIGRLDCTAAFRIQQLETIDDFLLFTHGFWIMMVVVVVVAVGGAGSDLRGEGRPRACKLLLRRAKIKMSHRR